MTYNSTSFKKGNQAHLIWTEEKAVEKFEEILEHAESNEEVYSIQQAHIECNIHRSTFYYLIEKFPELGKIKDDIGDIIVSRINKGVLKNKLNATGGIWRMKQLGEKDQQYMDSNVNTKIEDTRISKDEVKDVSNKLDNDY